MAPFRRWLPSRDSLRNNRWLRWIGPRLFDPHLWHARRRAIALGMAVGVFFGLLIPIAQIPASAAVAVVLRANVPAAVASTLVTNPFTFGPIYYAAWRVGSALLGESTPPPGAPAVPDASAAAVGFWASLQDSIAGVGQPLMLGLALFATVIGLATYLLVSLGWRLAVMRRRRRRIGRGARPR